jgi:hypothetical protein
MESRLESALESGAEAGLRLPTGADEAQAAAERLAEWSRRFMTSLHQQPDLHRAGLLIGAAASEPEEVTFWPFPEIGSLDDLASFLESEIPACRELEPVAVALVMPVAPGAAGLDLTLDRRDYDLLVVAVDAHRHCAALASPVSLEGEQVHVHGWQDLVGYVPAIAPLLFAAFPDLKSPRPQEDMEWALVEVATHGDEELPWLIAACACELAYRRQGEPEREFHAALTTRPQGDGWAAIVEEAARLRHRYQGYRREIAVAELEELAPALALLEESAVAQLFFAALVEKEVRQLDSECPLPSPAQWRRKRERLQAYGVRPGPPVTKETAGPAIRALLKAQAAAQTDLL